MLKEDFIISRIVSVFHIRTQTWNRPHAYKRLNNGLVLFMDGSISYNFNGITFTARPGDVVLFPVNIPYYGVKQSEYNEFIVIDFETIPEDRFFQITEPKKITVDNYTAMESRFWQVHKLYIENTVSSSLLLREVLYRILSELLAETRAPSNSASSLVMRAQQIIAKHFTENDFNVSTLSKALHVSSAYLRKTFTAELHISPVNYLIDYRIHQAENLLQDGNINISEIAYLCGFGSPEYFSRVFSSRKGYPPSHHLQKTLQR